jgi:hypothetical protein
MLFRDVGTAQTRYKKPAKINLGVAKLEVILISSVLRMEAFGVDTPPPFLSNGIIGLEENREIIYGAQ